MKPGVTVIVAILNDTNFLKKRWHASFRWVSEMTTDNEKSMQMAQK